LIAKHNVEASIHGEIINLNGKISDELVELLCSELELLEVVNKTDEIQDDNSETYYRNNYKIADRFVGYDLKYPKVKKGQIYFCDCGNSFGAETMGMRLVLIVQNDMANYHSPSTVIVPITSKVKEYESDCIIKLSDETMIDYDPSKVKEANSRFLCAQIKAIDKKRLRSYFGTLKPEALEKIDEKIKITLQLTGEIA
jgi:mRNA interferase MazF